MSVGIKKETYTTVMIDCLKAFGASSDFIRILECMQNSRMGFYICEKCDGQFVYLKELYTNKITKVFVPSGYGGVSGELWFVRLLPDPFGLFKDYSVAFTSPYIIVNAPPGKPVTVNRDLFYPEQAWLTFIERSLALENKKNLKSSYYHLMKYGIGKHYWLEYIFLAYVNFNPSAIWLTGFPDKPKTLPHAQ